MGTDLIYIKSEDHYLEVHTTIGSSLVKMRFSDAVAELGERGIQIHRSYWVATSHVTRSVRSGKRTVLRLTGDHKVPVSVTHLLAVRAILARSRTHGRRRMNRCSRNAQIIREVRRHFSRAMKYANSRRAPCAVRQFAPAIMELGILKC